MTLTKTGIGLSAGVRGAHISVNTHGRVTQSVGIPGTGLGYVKTSNLNAHRAPRRAAPHETQRSVSAPSSPVVRVPRAPGPSIFAPTFEKQLFKFLQGKCDLGQLRDVSPQTTSQQHTVLFVEALRVSLPQGDNSRTREIFELLFTGLYEPATDSLLNKYIHNTLVAVPIANGVSVELPIMNKDTVALMLAELEQSAGDIDRAITTVESVEPSTVAAVSLAELYALKGSWNEVVDLTDEISNADDASVFLLIQRGVAFREQKYFDASCESLKEALRVRTRSPELRKLALIERGKTYLSEGKNALARKDFEKVLADDSDYEGLQDLLDSLA